MLNSENSGADNNDEVLLEWTVHLMRRDPRRAFAVYAVMLFAAALGLLLFKSLLVALASAVMILLSTAEYLLPTRYKMTNRIVSAHCGLSQLEMEWVSVRRILETDEAVKLSPLIKPSRLEPFRGVVLRFSPDGSPGCRSAVMHLIEMHAKNAQGDAPDFENRDEKT